jgi:ferredoxin
MAMEGNGPNSGSPRKLSVLLFSSDPVALDAIACRIIGLNPEFVPTNLAGEEAGLGTYQYASIEVVGDDIGQFITPDFDVVRKRPLPFSGGRLMAFIKNRTCPRPVVNKDTCTRCGTCFEVCPVDPKAILWDPADEVNFPLHDYDRCIRCYCCQELCPEGAISIKGTLLGNLFFR